MMVKVRQVLVANNIDVDAGMILVGCSDYLKDVPTEDHPKNTGKILEVPNKIYTVNWRIRDTWNGDIRGSAEIMVRSGKIFVSDPCYFIADEEWQTWLDDTDYGRDLKSDKVFMIDDMGGDGCYEVELELI
jgi:hypothetical protein